MQLRLSNPFAGVKRTSTGQPLQRGFSQFTHWVWYLSLIGFTGTCTLLLLQHVTPPQDWWLPFFGLTVFEFGFIHWNNFHKYQAEGLWPNVISLLMFVASVIAITCATGSELATWFDVALPSWLGAAIKVVIVVLFVANVAAVACISLMNPEHIQRLTDRGLIGQDLTIVESKVSDVPAPVSVSPADIDYDRIINGVTQALMLQGPTTDPLAARSFPQTGQTRATAKQKN